MSDPHADCNQIRLLLDAFHDNELDAGERAVVEAHLRICDACRRGLAEISFVVDSMGKMPAVTLKRDLSDSIESRVIAAGNAEDATVKVVAAHQDCGEMHPLLDAFYDNELGPTEHEKVSEHLSGCEPCRHALADIGRIVVSLKNLPTLKPRRDVADNFEAVLAAKTKVVAFKKRVAWGSMGIAAAAAMIAFALHVGPTSAPGAVTVGANQTGPSQVEIAATSPSAPEQISSGIQAQQNNGVQHTAASRPMETTANPSTQKRDEHAKDNHSLQPSVVRQAPPMVAQNQDVAAPGKQITAPAADVAPTQIADAQVAPLKQQGENVIALYDGEANAAEELGITTDEDGLYAIKL